MIRVAAFTTGRHQPSTRFRVRQYIAALKAHGVALSEFSTRPGAYPSHKASLRPFRPFWAAYALAARVPGIVASHRFDVTLLQREMLSTFCTLEPFTRSPRILDVDDAIWFFRGGNSARKLARLSEAVICGNSFLADYFSQWNRNIVILPTAVDSDRFLPRPRDDRDLGLVIGWSGNRSGFQDLQLAEKPLRIILEKYPRAILRVMADEPPTLELPRERVEFVKWSPEVEVATIQSFDIGIMPLGDTLWSRGKCSYKMLLYMSCGVPVAVSPVGMNGEVCAMAPLGVTAATTEEWVSALELLLRDPEQARVMGKNGRETIVRHFSIEAIAPKLARALRQAASA